MYLPGEIVKRENGKIYFRVGQGNMILILNESEVNLVQNGVEIRDDIATKNPWIQLANVIKDKNYFMSRNVPEGTEVVLPMVNLEENTFLGYRVIADKNGNVLKVLDAGKYRRYSVPGLENFNLLLPVEKITDVTDLKKEEFGMLADATPPEMLPKIYEYDKNLAGVLTVEKLRRDPLSLATVPENDLKKLLEIAKEYWALASPESNPATIEMLIEELRGIAPNVVPELQYLRERLYEEKYEEKQIERMKKEQEKTYEEWIRRIREEEARRRAQQTMKEVKEILKTVAGVTLPLVLTKTPVMFGVKKTLEKAVETTAKMKEMEKEAVSE